MKKITVILTVFLMLFSCSRKGERSIVVASKPHAEQYILAEMITALIEAHTDISVEKKLGIGGGTSNIHPAVISGEIDIYPEYSGTGWLFVLKEDLIADPDKLFESVKKKYKEEYNIVWFNRYGFNNTYALAVKESVARDKNISSYSDLAAASNDLVFGAEYDFYERDDGFPSLKKIYGFNFKETKELDIGLKYQAIGEDQVDVINAFSTDGLIKEYNLRVLEDNKNFFPSYHAATIIRDETLKKYPELKNVLQKLEGAISDPEMIEMNYKVEKEKQDPRKVAQSFLEEKGLL